mmetsp:Transcript_27357/g.64563  ORF Transcript_27357/g.64563 Transcript_27357/m.64563 type:complete len:289 (-) Transcript_27357:125-991(-)
MPAEVRDEALGGVLVEEVVELVEKVRRLHNDVVALRPDVLDLHLLEESCEGDVGVGVVQLLLADVHEALLERHVRLQTLVHSKLGLDLNRHVCVVLRLLRGAAGKGELLHDEGAVGRAVRLHLLRVLRVERVVREDEAAGAEVEVAEHGLEVVRAHPPVEESRDVPELELGHDRPQVLVGLDLFDLRQVRLQRSRAQLVDLVEHHARVVPVPCRSGVLLQDLTHLVVDLGAAAVPRAREPAQVLWDLHVLQESAARVLIEVVAGVDSQVHLALHRLGEDSLHQGPRLQ